MLDHLKIRIFVLVCLVFNAFSPSSLAQYDVPIEEADQKESSGTRGCPVALPELRIELSPLKQNPPIITLYAEKSQYPLKMSIYPVENNIEGQEVTWKFEGVTTEGWHDINPNVTLDSGRKYAFAAVVLCQGDIDAGTVLRTVFKAG